MAARHPVECWPLSLAGVLGGSQSIYPVEPANTLDYAWSGTGVTASHSAPLETYGVIGCESLFSSTLLTGDWGHGDCLAKASRKTSKLYNFGPVVVPSTFLGRFAVVQIYPYCPQTHTWILRSTGSFWLRTSVMLKATCMAGVTFVQNHNARLIVPGQQPILSNNKAWWNSQRLRLTETP